MAKFNPPESFPFDRPTEWSDWKQRFQRFRVATRLNKEDGEVQVSSLIYAMGPEAENIFKAFTFAEDADKEKFDVVLGKYDEYFYPKRNVIHERACFHQRVQRPGEKAEMFIRALYELSEHCDFGAQREEHIRDRIVVGISDKEMSRKLQLETQLTLSQTIQAVRQSEEVTRQVNQQGEACAAVQERKMAETLSDLDGVAIYMDDVLVYGDTAEQHDQRLNKVLERIESAGLKLNKDKCVFRRNQLHFLGQVIDKSGVKPDPDKLDHQNVWGSPAVVAGDSTTPRSYVIETQKGATLRRNRRHLLCVPASSVTTPPPSLQQPQPDAVRQATCVYKAVGQRFGRGERPLLYSQLFWIWFELCSYQTESLVQKIDQRLPVANEYLLLSGGARDGVLDLNPADVGSYAKGTDFDLDFTLLVPALKLHDRNQPVTLDMRHSSPCHSWLSLRLCEGAVLQRWGVCCEEEGGAEEEEEERARGASPSLGSPQALDGCYFSPSLVSDWFWGVVQEAVEELRRSPQRGIPTPERLERNGPLTTIILQAGSSRVLYDLLPVVSFRGWPAVAQGWLTANHFWDGKITEEEAISGFYLLPCPAPAGGRADREWRLAFSRSEVQLKKCIPFPMAQAFQAAKSILAPVLARPRSGLSLYHLRTLLFWACDRLPGSFLSCDSPDTPARLLLGLLDDLAHCILSKTCPNYFLPQCNMLEHLEDAQALFLARKLACVRSDPLEQLRAARQAGQLKKELQNGGGSPGHQGGGHLGGGHEDRLAQRLQQLVTENPGKSISVFLNPDDVTRPHFRIDDKFY
uniref:ribonuclease H n=1 Tax=Knipowitschia caucasica TaxID=637954 RepID=A0AAV2KQF7_KNICA